MNLIPALSILATFVIIVLVLIFKFKSTEIIKVFDGKNFFLLGTLTIVFLLLIFCLFETDTPWASDLLKIAVGIFAGAGAVTFKDKVKSNDGALSLDHTQINGVGHKLAGRDINETVHNIEKAFGDIKDSVVNQNNKIQQFLNTSGQLDHSIHMLYSRENVLDNIQRIISRRLNEGWNLSSIEFAYQQLDGTILLFTRPKRGEHPEFTLLRDINFEQIYPR